MLNKTQRYVILFFLLFYCFNANSQSIVPIKIEWKNSNTDRSNTFFCSNCINHATPRRVKFIKTVEVPFNKIGQAEFINIKTEELNEAVEVDTDFKLIAEIGKAGQDNLLYLSGHVIRKNPTTGKTERLLSCDLSVSGTNIPKGLNNGLRAASSSVLSTGNWYKIAIKEQGIYKLDFDFVKNTMQIDPGSFSLSTCGIFGYSNGLLPTENSQFRFDDLPENNIKIVDLNNNDKLDQGDYILFYAQGNTRWKRTDSLFQHEMHLYSDKSHYFFSPNAGHNKKVLNKNSAASGEVSIQNFTDYFYYEKELENPLKSGRVWLGEAYASPSSSKTITFNIPNIDATVPALIRTSFAANGSSASSQIDVSINNQLLGSMTIIPTAESYRLKEETYKWLNPSDNAQITYTFKNSSLDAKGYLDFSELLVKRKFVFNGTQYCFRTTEYLGTSKSIEAAISASAAFELWNVTDIQNIYNVVPVQAGQGVSKIVFNNQTLQEFVIFSETNVLKPTFVSKVENQNIHALSAADYFIIAAKQFMPAAEKLAAFHREWEKYRVHILDIEKIYNEFGSGTKDLTAIRDMIRFFYDRAQGDANQQPKSVLLMGDASYDYKGIISNTDVIPTYESVNSWEANETFNTDDYIAYMDPNEGGDDIIAITNFEDIGVGRLPCNTLSQAESMVNKIINYKKNPLCYKDWRNYIAVVADDVDDSYDYAFQQQSEDFVSKRIQDSLQSFNIEKIYLDAYKQESSAGGSRYPDANKILMDRINFGSLALSYIGHGGPTNWAQERLFGNTEIAALKNINALPFFITATCDFSPFDNPNVNSAGENLITNPNGGAVSIISTTRTVYISNNGTLVWQFFNFFFNKKNNRYLNIGEITRRTKMNLAKDNNARKFVLLGDPALVLNYPEFNVVTTAINDKSDFSKDTLKALQKVTIKGEVRDWNNALMSDFNGICYPTVFDKEEVLKTLKNDFVSPDFNFPVQKNIVFKGKCSIVNGQFQFTFIVPKDINYSIASGKISYYAESASTGQFKDASGYDKKFFLGGSNENAGTDNIGPEIKMFMNKENFANGGTTDENPVLLAKLFDESGINTVGNGIGHDITGIIDENTKNAVVLNNYYEAEINDFTKGKLNYNFYKLSEGNHTLRLKAWDVYNNPGDAKLDFVVAKNAKLALKQLLNYPNPFTTNTCFQFEHNKINEQLDVTIQIFTVSGKIVKSIHQKVMADSYRMDKQLCWDGLDNYGDRIGRGVYVYKVNIRDAEGNTAGGVQKLVILK